MTSERPDPKTQVESAQATYNIAHDDNPDPTNVEGRLPQQIARREIKRVVIKISGSNELLEMEGDDVDLGTDLKIRYHHQLVAERNHARREVISSSIAADEHLMDTLPDDLRRSFGQLLRKIRRAGDTMTLRQALAERIGEMLEHAPGGADGPR